MNNLASQASPEGFRTFGELLRYLRRQARLTQRELSIEVGYSEPQISYLEKNHRLPDVTTVRARFLPALYLDPNSPFAQRLIFLAEAARIAGQSGVEAPYKGLHYFDVQDADLFFGREQLIAQLVKHLRKHKFLAIVVGASGSGKSSIVRAGLVPALQRGQRLADGGLPPSGSAHWKYVIVTPGANPLESLISVLRGDDASGPVISRSLKDFIADEKSLDESAGEMLNRAIKGSISNRDHIFLIVDQFEELFTLCQDEETRQAFIDNLMYSASPQSGGFTSIVIALRADFYAHCAQYPNLRDGLAHYQEYIGPMSLNEIRRAIEQPALNAGLAFESGLVDLILKDIGEEPGVLPLLSHALLETWKRRQQQILTFRGYNQSGGIRGAIAHTAEEVYLKLNAEQQASACKIFLALTELGQASQDGLLMPDTRRRVPLSELILDPRGSSVLENLLSLLTDARLIIVTENSVEVAHEALIREWPRLRDWLSEDRENLMLHRQINAGASRWDEDGRKPEDLYRGSRLSQALEWVEKRPGELSALEKAFLDASNSWLEKEIAEQEAQRKNELLAAKKLAESESLRAEENELASYRLRRRAWLLSMLLVLASILAVAALSVSRQRDETAKLATSRELASASVSNLGVDPERSILLALEALSIKYSPEAEDGLHRAVLTSRVEMTLRGHEGIVGVAVYNPVGSQIATAGENGDVKIWDAESGKNSLTLSGHEGPVYEVIFNRDGSRIATAGEDGTARIWDSTSGKRLMTFEGQQGAFVGLAFSPDGERLAAGSVDGSVTVWEVDSGDQILSFPAHEDVVISIAFSPDGTQFVTSSFDYKLIFWNASSGEKLQTWEGEFDNLAFSDDGKRLVANFISGVKIVDVDTGANLLTTGGHTNQVYTAAISPDWSMIASAGLDRKAVVSDAQTGQELFNLSGHTGEVLDIHFSPDGKHLVTASADGSARIWNAGATMEALTIKMTRSHGRIAFNPAGSAIAAGDQQDVKMWDIENGNELFSFKVPIFATGVSFDPNGSRLAGASEAGVVMIWDIDTGTKALELKASDEMIWFLTFSPDGKMLATAGEDGTVKIWDAKNGKLLSDLSAHEEAATVVAFSPDSTHLVSGGVDRIAIVWDTRSGEKLQTLQGHSDIVWGAAFSPDGKRIATASRDGTARIWEVESGEELLMLSGHSSTLGAVLFSADGRQLATASRDGLTQLWGAEDGELQLTLYGDGSGINGVAFSPDGTRLAAGGNEGLWIYLLRVEALIELAKTRLTRSMTEEECKTYLHLDRCPADP